MNILGHYYFSFEIIISVSFFCEIGFSFLPTASSVCDLIAGSHTFCYRDLSTTLPLLTFSSLIPFHRLANSLHTPFPNLLCLLYFFVPFLLSLSISTHFIASTFPSSNSFSFSSKSSNSFSFSSKSSNSFSFSSKSSNSFSLLQIKYKEGTPHYYTHTSLPHYYTQWRF